MSKPSISVVIPAFNRATTIRRAIESVQAQHFADFEIIVVDDASTDDTREAVLGLDEPRMRLVVRSVNGGASAARNSGIRAAKADLIAFLDSDDAWKPDKLRRQFEAMSSPGARPVSCTGAVIHLLDHGETRIKRLEDTPDWARRLAMDCDLSPGSTQMAARAVFDEIGLLDETLPRFEDWDWLLRYTRSRAILAVSEPLADVYNRRGRLGDIVERSARLFQSKHQGVFDALAPADRRQALADLWLQAAGTYAFERRFACVLRPALQAARYRPFHTAARLTLAVLIRVRRGVT
jgi:glycosyltransferase involved in cell wall biosynthesis